MFQLPKQALYQTEPHPDISTVAYFNNWEEESQEEKREGDLAKEYFVLQICALKGKNRTFLQFPDYSNRKRKEKAQQMQGNNLDYLGRIVIIVMKQIDFYEKVKMEIYYERNSFPDYRYS